MRHTLLGLALLAAIVALPAPAAPVATPAAFTILLEDPFLIDQLSIRHVTGPSEIVSQTRG